MLAGSSVVNDEHLRSLFFGDYMFPEADAKIYDEVRDGDGNCCDGLADNWWRW